MIGRDFAFAFSLISVEYEKLFSAIMTYFSLCFQSKFPSFEENDGIFVFLLLSIIPMYFSSGKISKY